VGVKVKLTVLVGVTVWVGVAVLVGSLEIIGVGVLLFAEVGLLLLEQQILNRQIVTRIENNPAIRDFITDSI
jgi:hypothetical protein